MTSELTELSIVIGDIYSASVNLALWQRALGSICSFLDGVSAILVRQDTATRQAQTLSSFNDDPHYTKLYIERYLALNPAFQATASMEAGAMHAAGAITSHDAFVKTRFYQEWAEPQGIVDFLILNVERDTTHASFIDIRFGRAHGMAGDATRLRLTLLVPHIQRAMTISRLLNRNTVAAPDALPRLEILARDHKLTASEARVLDAVLKTNTVRAIAETLGLSQATVKTHLHNVFRKTGAIRRSDLVKLLVGI